MSGLLIKSPEGIFDTNIVKKVEIGHALPGCNCRGRTHAQFRMIKKIITGADVVKLKEQYPSHYQSIGLRMAASVHDRAAGAMTSRNDRYTIQLFRRANLSTLAHELMHAVQLLFVLHVTD